MKLRGLYAITDSQLLDDGRLLPYVEAALRGGARLLQYRDKSSDQARRLREAESLRELCERYGAQLIVNDDAELAARLGVGLHLGQTDGSLSAARALLGRQAIIGATCHARLELAEQAVAEGASYVAFGRFFNSSTKPGAPRRQRRTARPGPAAPAPADHRHRRHQPRHRVRPDRPRRRSGRRDPCAVRRRVRRRGGTPRPRLQRPVRTCLTPPRLAREIES